MARVTKSPEERRSEIIDASMKVFYEKGYESTSISDIAKEIGVAQGLCYRYFSSKEEIFDTAIDKYAQKQVDNVISALDDKLSIKDLIKTVPSFLDVENDESFAQKFCHKEGNKKFHLQLTLKICDKLMPIVEKIFKKSYEKGEINIKNFKMAASFFLYGQLGLIFDSDTEQYKTVEDIRTFMLNIFENM